MPKAGKKKALDPLLEVHNAITRNMHRQHHTAHMFICKRNLEKVWADHPLSHIFPNFTREEQESIREHYICVLSILIYVGWTGMNLFRPLFLRETGRDDAHLPFNDLSFLGTSGQVFLSHQHAFKPVVIEEHNERHIQEIPTEGRLPFIDEPEVMGNGGYGSVTKRVIAPRCLWNKENNTDNPEPKPVACKIYKTEIPDQDFKKELGNLDFIKEGLTDSKRVMKHIAAIVHGDEFMIILPLANLYNLEIFLRGGYEPNPGTDDLKLIYDFDVKFPMLNTSDRIRHAVVKEAHQMASALKWLHEDLKIFGFSDRYLAHMDLKPANVLLVGDARSPAGKWMLSDFGVSSFDKETNARVRDTPSIGDVGLRFTSRGFQDNLIRGHGPYQPPEVDLDNVDSRKCDVWSFGCVLCDILAFAMGKTQAVTELRKARYGPDDDYFYETKAPTRKRIKEIDDSNTELKSQIVDWWTDLERSSSTWVIKYIQVLRKALKPKPSDRPGIGDIVDGLNKLAPSMAPNSQLASSKPQTNGLTFNDTLEPQERRPSIIFSEEPSPQHHEEEALEDAARTGGIHGQSSRNFLSPKAALDRERVLPARNEKDGSQSLSGTDILNGGATHANPVHVVPDVLERRPPPPPDEPTPERHTPSVSISAYREGPKISISLPKKQTVKAVAITPSAVQVAVLCKHSVHLYSTIDGGEMGRPIDLSPKVDWTKIRLASQYLAVYGLGLSHDKRVEVFDSKTMAQEAIVPTHSEMAQDILLSDEEVLAYVYGRYVRFYFIRLKLDLIIPINEDDAFILQAKFSASGKILCVWATGTRADHAYFVRVNQEPASVTVCGKGSYQKIDINSPTYNIWPCLDSLACVIHEVHGGAFLAQPLDQPQLGPRERNSVEISHALTACVVRDDLFVCLKSRQFHSERLLCGFVLSQEIMGQRCIAGQHRDLCAANKGIKKSTATAARHVDGKSELVLCTITGKVLRYVQS